LHEHTKENPSKKQVNLNGNKNKKRIITNYVKVKMDEKRKNKRLY
jgi:ribosomal protein S8